MGDKLASEQPKTVRFRIAVAIDDAGHGWAYGFHGVDEDAAKEAANRILSNKWDNNELASEISAQDARTVAAAFLEAIQW